jgi:hypothetical protein
LSLEKANEMRKHDQLRNLKFMIEGLDQGGSKARPKAPPKVSLKDKNNVLKNSVKRPTFVF